MIEIPISEIRLGDVRSRAIVSLEGQHVEGEVLRATVFGRQDGFTKLGPEKDWYELVLLVGKAKVETGHLPPDFLVQIHREDS